MELLRDGKITRSAAVVVWTDDTEKETMLKPTYESLKKRLSKEWHIFKGDQLELMEDFPEIEEYSLVIIPDYSCSPVSVELTKELGQILFPDDPDSWKEILNQLSTDMFAGARTTYTVGELVDEFLDEEMITEEHAEKVTPKMSDRIFD
jgi:hypothetical protein